MTAKTRALSRTEVAQSRRQIAVETLTSALSRDGMSMRLALAMLADGGMFSAEERTTAEGHLTSMDEIYCRVSELYGKNCDSDKVAQLHVKARTLVEEIAVLRESAFWLLTPDGMLGMEKVILAQLRVYQDVRRLLQIITAKDAEIVIPSIPPELPAIPANPYFPVTHPELVA